MNIRTLTLLLSLVLAHGAQLAHGEVIYFDDFSGSSADPLSGTLPDTRPGVDPPIFESWVSNGNPGWRADGSAGGALTSVAALPFSPVNGKIYELSADLSPGGFGQQLDYFALAFFRGLGDTYEQRNPRLVKIGDFGSFNFDAYGVYAPEDSDSFSAADFVGVYPSNPTKFKVVLNTTNPSNWTGEYYVDGVHVRGPLLVTDIDINRVGIIRRGDVHGSVANFKLEAVPEPSTILLAITSAAIVVHRTRRRHSLPQPPIPSLSLLGRG